MGKTKVTSTESTKCKDCNKEKAPDKAPETYILYPNDANKEIEFCACIHWKTMKQCAELSLINAESLVNDAELLLKHKRFSSSLLLTVFALEEAGKAHLSLEYFIKEKNVSVNGNKGDFKTRFCNHRVKIGEALKIARTQQQLEISKIIFQNPLEDVLFKEKLGKAHVDYDFKLHVWHMPITSNPQSLMAPYGELFSLKEANKLLEASGKIDSVIIGDYIDTTRTAIAQIRAELSSITT